MDNCLNLIYFLLHYEQIDYMYLYIANTELELMFKDV